MKDMQALLKKYIMKDISLLFDRWYNTVQFSFSFDKHSHAQTICILSSHHVSWISIHLFYDARNVCLLSWPKGSTLNIMSHKLSLGTRVKVINSLLLVLSLLERTYLHNILLPSLCDFK